MSLLLSQLFHDPHNEAWNEFDLSRLTLSQVQVLCRALGAPKSGTKEKVIVRLLAVRQVRLAIAKYGADQTGIETLAGDNMKERLKWMAKEAGLWRSGNKRQLAAVLLTWRERCRFEGRKFVEEAMAQIATQHRQLTLNL